MALSSSLFRGDSRLEAASVNHPAHIVPGAQGDHVAKLQYALRMLDDAVIDALELSSKRYGPSTANAVLAYKQKRDIINPSYQKQADNIVGIMTIAALDREMLQFEQDNPIVVSSIHCAVPRPRRPAASA